MIKKILDFQERYNNTEHEDEWFGKRIILWPDSKVAKAKDERRFSVEDIWHDKPLGFHLREGGNKLAENVWRDPKKRKLNFKYCPELAIIMPMKLERERCESVNIEGDVMTADSFAVKAAQKAQVDRIKAEMKKTADAVKVAAAAAVDYTTNKGSALPSTAVEEEVAMTDIEHIEAEMKKTAEAIKVAAAAAVEYTTDKKNATLLL